MKYCVSHRSVCCIFKAEKVSDFSELRRFWNLIKDLIIVNCSCFFFPRFFLLRALQCVLSSSTLPPPPPRCLLLLHAACSSSSSSTSCTAIFTYFFDHPSWRGFLLSASPFMRTKPPPLMPHHCNLQSSLNSSHPSVNIWKKDTECANLSLYLRRPQLGNHQSLHWELCNPLFLDSSLHICLFFSPQQFICNQWFHSTFPYYSPSWLFFKLPGLLAARMPSCLMSNASSIDTPVFVRHISVRKSSPIGPYFPFSIPILTKQTIDIRYLNFF